MKSFGVQISCISLAFLETKFKQIQVAFSIRRASPLSFASITFSKFRAHEASSSS